MESSISSNIKYDFNQILYCLLGFVGNLELKLREIIPELPVFVLQTGDQTFYLDKKFIQTTNTEILQKIPRFVITCSDIQPLSEQNTNQYNKINYKYLNIETSEIQIYTCIGRRISLEMPIDCNFISSNFIKMLENFMVFTSISSRPNVFTYEFMGNTYEASYVLASNNNENPGMTIDSGTRNSNSKFTINLDLQVFVPRIETIKLLSEIETYGFNLISIGGTSDVINETHTLTAIKSKFKNDFLNTDDDE